MSNIKNVTITSIKEAASSPNETLEGMMQYPLDLTETQFVTSFRVKSLYENELRDSSSPKKASAKNTSFMQETPSIILLYQTPLTISYGQNWAKQEGIFAEHGDFKDSLAKTATVGKVFGEGGSTVLGLTEQFGKAFGKSAASATAKTLWGGNMTASTGVAMNPFLGVAYESPNLRTLSIPYVFEPRSEKEAQAAINIINSFKFYSSPSYNKKAVKLVTKAAKKAGNIAETVMEHLSLDKAFLDAPDAFEIDFLNLEKGYNDSLFKFGPAVCMDVSCNYSSNGIWRAFKNGLPVSVELTLTFQEMEIVTREKIVEGY